MHDHDTNLSVNATAAVHGWSPLQLWCESAKVKHLHLRCLLVAYGAPVADLPSDGVAAQLPECFAVTDVVPTGSGAWTRRAVSLVAWVHWQDGADGVPSLTSRVAAVRRARAMLQLPPSASASCTDSVGHVQTIVLRSANGW